MSASATAASLWGPAALLLGLALNLWLMGAALPALRQALQGPRALVRLVPSNRAKVIALAPRPARPRPQLAVSVGVAGSRRLAA